jgi:thiol-disulfide isomerase/thioredoxin
MKKVLFFLVGLSFAALADPHRDFFQIKKQLATAGDDPNVRVRYTQLALVTGNYKEAEEGLQWIRTNNVADWTEWATIQTKNLALLGKPAPEFQGKDLEGWTIKKSDFESRVVLIHFWSTVDGVSQESLPQLTDIVKRYKANPYFTVFGVSLDKDTFAVKTVTGINKITWPQILEPEGVNSPTAKAFGILATPSLVLLDGDGIVRYVGSFGQMLNDATEVAVGRINDKKAAATAEVRMTPRSKDNKVFTVQPLEIYSASNPAKVQSKLKPGALLTLGKPDPASGMITVIYDDPETGRVAQGLVRVPGENVK